LNLTVVQTSLEQIAGQLCDQVNSAYNPPWDENKY